MPGNSPLLYDQYKIGTKIIWKFLVDETNLRGQPLEFMADSDPGPTVSKSKRKKTGTAPQPPISRFIHAAADMAAAARSSKPPPAELDNIIAITRDAIYCRRAYATFHAQKVIWRPRDEQTSDAGHHFIINALVNILSSLEKTKKNSRKQKAKRGLTPTTTGGASTGPYLSNLFNHLTLEDPDLDTQIHTFPPAIELRKHYNKSSTESMLSYACSFGGEDKAFALWCFLEECHNIRAYMREQWVEYEKGKLGFYAVSQLTEAAFFQMTCASVDFMEKFTTVTNFDHVAEVFDVELSTVDGNLETLSYKASSRASTVSGAEFAEVLCIPALTVLSMLRAFYNKAELQPEKLFDVADHIAHGHPLGATLIQLIGEFNVLFSRREGSGDLDTFTASYIDFLGSGETPLQFAMMFQTCMEISEVIRDHRGHMYGCLRAISSEVKTGLGEYDDFAAKLTEGGRYGKRFSDSPCRQHIRNIIENLVERPFENTVQRLICDGGTDAVAGADTDDPLFSSLLLELPLFSGSLIAQILQLRHIDAVEMCNYGDLVLACAHLYTASRTAGFVDQSWPDMDFVIEQHGRDFGLKDTGVSTKPMLSASRTFGMALGVPATVYSRSRNAICSSIPQRVPLPIADSVAAQKSPILKSPSKGLTAVDDIRQKNERLGFSRYTADREALNELFCTVLKDGSEGVDPAITARWNEVRNLSPVQILSLLKILAVREERVFHFDYHSFSIVCASFLDRFREKHRKRLTEYRAAHGLSPNFTIRDMVDDILWQAAEFESLSISHQIELNRQGTTTFLKMCGEQLSGVIRDVGECSSTAVVELCSGNIAHHAKPGALPLDVKPDKPEERLGRRVELAGGEVKYTVLEVDEAVLKKRKRLLVRSAVARKWLVKEGMSDEEKQCGLREELTFLDAE